jgi:glycosyltransferase involved in cell wall biosynthesis
MYISVIVPVFNSEKYIEQCIHALLDQDYPKDSYEIIMVDNNSTDMSARIISRYPSIRLLQEPVQSAYPARNRGIRFAKGDVIAFTDPDCRPYPQWLSSIASAISHPGHEIIMGYREHASSSKGLAMLYAYEALKAAYVFSSNHKEIYFGYTNNMAVRSSLFKKLGNFMMIDRGADTVFVRKAVEEYGCDIVSFAPKMSVKHLEMIRVMDFYKKQLIYGKSNESNQVFGSARPLNKKERFRVFRNTVRERQYSLRKTVQLFALLVLGLFFYEYGRRRAE